MPVTVLRAHGPMMFAMLRGEDGWTILQGAGLDMVSNEAMASILADAINALAGYRASLVLPAAGEDGNAN